MRRALLAVLLPVAACGAGHEQVCTAMGAPDGVELDVRLLAAQTGTVEVCWDGRCVTRDLVLSPAYPAAGPACTGGTSEACATSAGPAEWKLGTAPIPGMPAKQVTVRLKLLDAAGLPVVDRELTATAEKSYPNGPHCDPGEPLLALRVGADGSVVQR
ncbi:hypothetical protein AB0I60_04395 [Actinosynnema sp. NPDC050436]|uniref:hypothetical protein n=1 Tax=Actinosynnema sp. NPDC050436 TaxID=3155659 RepID=UPI0033FF28E0